jgi:hypothetical protein
MMEIEQSWGRLVSTEQLPEEFLKGNQWHRPSGLNPLARLKRGLRINMYWAVLIAVLYILSIFYFPITIFRITMMAMLLFTGWGLISTYRMYGQLDPRICYDCTLVSEMQRHYEAIHNWMRIQEKVALFFYPIGAAGGFLLGGVLGSGKPIAEIMSKTTVQVAFVLAILLLTPAGYYLARWLNQKAFGKHLDALRSRIDALNAEG